MSTQHPDCANLPDFVNGDVFSNDEEVFEALNAFRLGCDEQLWDWEGKEVDTHVVRKLLSLDEKFFRENVLGEDVFITYRIPNPEVEGAERKLVVEALESIPRNFDVARKFYGNGSAPIIEVALPMTTSHGQMLRVRSYYEDVVVNKENAPIHGGMKLKEWIGEFNPKTIGVIPLIEDMQSILNTEKILGDFLSAADVEYVRPWIARSDTALNYGLVPSMLLVKLFLSAVASSESKTGVPHHPILATGALPFRGGLNPDNVENFLKEYDAFKTYALQSSAKYDFGHEKVTGMIDAIKKHSQRKAVELGDDEKQMLLGLVERFSGVYRKRIEGLAHAVNIVSGKVPNRRSRHLHIGLFGYSRNFSDTVKLPRAIKFAASLYSIGLPPEIIGISSLNAAESGGNNELSRFYTNLKEDLRMISGFISRSALKAASEKGLVDQKTLGMISEDIEAVESLGIEVGAKTLAEEEHELLAKRIVSDISGEKTTSRITEAAKIRRSLG